MQYYTFQFGGESRVPLVVVQRKTSEILARALLHCPDEELLSTIDVLCQALGLAGREHHASGLHAK